MEEGKTTAESLMDLKDQASQRYGCVEIMSDGEFEEFDPSSSSDSWQGYTVENRKTLEKEIKRYTHKVKKTNMMIDAIKLAMDQAPSKEGPFEKFEYNFEGVFKVVDFMVENECSLEELYSEMFWMKKNWECEIALCKEELMKCPF